MAKYTDSIDNPLITAIIAHAVNAGIGIAAEAGLLSMTSVNTWTVAVIPIVTMVIAGAIAFFHGHNAQKSWTAMQQALASKPVLQPHPGASRVNPTLADTPSADPTSGLPDLPVMGSTPPPSGPTMHLGSELGPPPRAGGGPGPEVRGSAQR